MKFMTFHSVGNSNPNWRTHLFQRGSYTIFSIMGCHPSHWLSYFSRWLKPPTSSAYLWFIDGIINGLLMSYGIWNHQPDNSRADSSSGTSMEIYFPPGFPPGPRVSGLRGVLRRQRLWAVTWQTAVVGIIPRITMVWMGKSTRNPSEMEVSRFLAGKIHQKWRFLAEKIHYKSMLSKYFLC